MTRLGIVGLPNSGKSTVFHAATRAPSAISEVPFTTLKVVRASLRVPGRRTLRIELMDTPGLARGARSGRGLGNGFLEELRACDILVHVVRVFSWNALGAPHPEGRIAPTRDIDLVETEMQMADAAVIRERLNGDGRQITDGTGRGSRPALEQAAEAVEGGQSARQMGLSPEELSELLGLKLLTAKPLIYVVNADEDDLYSGPATAVPKDLALRVELDGAPCLLVSGKLEADAAALEGPDGVLMLEELGIKGPIGERLAEAASRILGSAEASAHVVSRKERRAGCCAFGPSVRRRKDTG